MGSNGMPCVACLPKPCHPPLCLSDGPCKLTVAASPNSFVLAILEGITNEDGELDFQQIVPPPHDYEGVDWYDWNVEHWGTKWNAVDPERIELDNKAFTFKFETAYHEVAIRVPV